MQTLSYTFRMLFSWMRTKLDSILWTLLRWMMTKLGSFTTLLGTVLAISIVLAVLLICFKKKLIMVDPAFPGRNRFRCRVCLQTLSRRSSALAHVNYVHLHRFLLHFCLICLIGLPTFLLCGVLSIILEQ